MLAAWCGSMVAVCLPSIKTLGLISSSGGKKGEKGMRQESHLIIKGKLEKNELNWYSQIVSINGHFKEIYGWINIFRSQL